MYQISRDKFTHIFVRKTYSQFSGNANIFACRVCTEDFACTVFLLGTSCVCDTLMPPQRFSKTVTLTFNLDLDR